THNLPIDVAAWEAMRSVGPDGSSPLVVAPKTFLGRARLSDTIPTLKARLARLPDDRGILRPADLCALDRGTIAPCDPYRALSPQALMGVLDGAGDASWQEGSDAADGLLKILRAVDAAEGSPAAAPPSATIDTRPVEPRVTQQQQQQQQ